jgi:Fic family protein
MCRLQEQRAENRKLHPVELAALVHLKIISIQPFADGNSRLSRLLMNWVLWKKGYPLIDIKAEDLENYYNALDLYQIEHQEKPFVEYIMETFLEMD